MGVNLETGALAMGTAHLEEMESYRLPRTAESLNV